MEPTNLVIDASLEKVPTMLVRRLIWAKCEVIDTFRARANVMSTSTLFSASVVSCTNTF